MASELYSGALPIKGVHDTLVLLTSAARTETAGDEGDAVRLTRPANALMFILDVTAAATDVGDTLDAQVQTSVEIGGTTVWIPVCSFTQVLGNGGAKRHVGKIVATEAQAMFENGASLAAGSIRHLFGDSWRVRWVIADADANASFTFSVVAVPM